MAGVTILSDNTNFSMGMTIFTIFISLITVFWTILEFSKSKPYTDVAGSFTCMLLIVLGMVIIGFNMYYIIHPDKLSKTYKVTVDDTVKLNEFTEKYKIISQDGSVFEVKLRK